MTDIYLEIDRLLAAGQKMVLARIIRLVGSAPRSPGTKCLVLEDGTLIGTIGGGLLEYETSMKAAEVMRAGRSMIFNMRLTGNEVAESSMLCGGVVDVYLEPVFPGNDAAHEVFRSISEVARKGRKGTLLTRIADGITCDDPRCRLFVSADGTRTGGLNASLEDPKDGSRKWVKSRRPALLEPDAASGGPSIFMEPVEPEAVLYLFGAGHVSTFVAFLAKMVGFHVVVIDDRSEFANTERFPSADEIKVCSYAEAFAQVAVTGSSFIAIITRGHHYDRDVLRSALQTGAAYIGMISSRRKREVIYQSLREEGVGLAALDRVHSPIGLKIGAESPEEIAVSIVAELIRIRAAGAQGGPKRTPA